MREFLSGDRCRVEFSMLLSSILARVTAPPPHPSRLCCSGRWGGGIDHNSHVVAWLCKPVRKMEHTVKLANSTDPTRDSAASSSSSFHVLFTAHGGLATLRSARVTPTSCCCLPFPLIADILFSRSASSRFYTR